MQQYSKQDVKNIIEMVVAQFGEGPTGVDEFVEVVLSDYTPPPSSHQGDDFPVKLLETLIYYGHIHTVEGVRPADMKTHKDAIWEGIEWLRNNCDIVDGEYKLKSEPAPPTPVEGPTPTIWKDIEEELIECYEDYPAMNAEQDARKKIDEWKAKSQQEFQGSNGLRWVKASERLPKHLGSPEIHYRLDGFHKVLGNFYDKEDGEIVFGVIGVTHPDYDIYRDKWSGIEWLEESDSPAPEHQSEYSKGFEAGALFQLRKSESPCDKEAMEIIRGAANLATKDIELIAYGRNDPAPEQVDVIDAYKEYVQLLTDELSELAGVAAVHGWKSTRHEKGVELRNKIESIQNKQA